MRSDFNSILEILHGSHGSDQKATGLIQAKLDDIYKMLVQALSMQHEMSDAIIECFDRMQVPVRIKLLASPELWDAVGILKSHRVDELDRLGILKKVRLIAARLVVAEGLQSPQDTNLVLEQIGRVTVSPLGNMTMSYDLGGTWLREKLVTVGGTIALDFDSSLATQNDPASVVFSLPCLEWTKSEKQASREKFESAIAYIDDATPHLGRLVRNFVRRIFLRKSFVFDAKGRMRGQFAISSEHLPRYPGTIGISNPQTEANTVVKLMESVLHESVHNFLACHETAHGHFMSSDRSYRPVSPWSGNSIPNHSLSHAIFVYYACYCLFEQCLATDVFEHASEREQAEIRAGDFAAGFLIEAELSSLFALDRPMKDGLRHLMDQMQERVKDSHTRVLYQRDAA